MRCVPCSIRSSTRSAGSRRATGPAPSPRRASPCRSGRDDRLDGDDGPEDCRGGAPPRAPRCRGDPGGHGAALATGMAFAAVGGDTGGSNRQPAALCGVVGVKVTYGRVSRHGGIPLSWSMDTVGPMARTVGDAAALLQVMAGSDPKDPTTRRGPVPDYVASLGGDLKGVRVGLPHNAYMEVMEPEVGAAVQE